MTRGWIQVVHSVVRNGKTTFKTGSTSTEIALGLTKDSHVLLSFKQIYIAVSSLDYLYQNTMREMDITTL